MDRDNLESVYESLNSINSLKKLPASQALNHLANLIDISSDLKKPEGIRKAISLAESKNINFKRLSSEQRAFYFYCLGNAWDDLRLLFKSSKSEEHWFWIQEEFTEELINYRKSINEKGFDKLSPNLKCLIYTNLGNILDTIGRYIEAIDYYDNALSIDSSFGMALANKGLCLKNYANMVYDQSHQKIILRHALDCLIISKKNLEYDPQYSFVAKQNEHYISDFSKHLGEKCIKCNCSNELNNKNISKTKSEEKYRNWCLSNRLFLHPINDLGKYSSIAFDFISTPSITTELEVGPKYQGFFNQIKQEFVSSRYLFYEGINSRGIHFSDREVILINTLDYPVYCFALEKIKLAYRSTYSIFDKIATFIDDYFELMQGKKFQTFRKVWYLEDRVNKVKILHPKLERKHNLPLRGLFWLSRDFYEDLRDFKETNEPESKGLCEIRNSLEHGYLKIHEYDNEYNSNSIKDTLAKSISYYAFKAKTMRILKLARASIIYLSCAIHIEEINKEKNRPENGLILPITCDIYEDEWKRI